MCRLADNLSAVPLASAAAFVNKGRDPVGDSTGDTGGIRARMIRSPRLLAVREKRSSDEGLAEARKWLIFYIRGYGHGKGSAAGGAILSLSVLSSDCSRSPARCEVPHVVTRRTVSRSNVRNTTHCPGECSSDYGFPRCYCLSLPQNSSNDDVSRYYNVYACTSAAKAKPPGTVGYLLNRGNAWTAG